MPNPKKIIFLEGVDGSGKTTRAKKLMELDLPVKYFRSNFQVGSSFAGQPVDLEESLKHDWRVLHDFIVQTSDPDSFLMIDRGFLSSYIYGEVLRNKDTKDLVDTYLGIFHGLAEYWVFIREDEGMGPIEARVNDKYKELEQSLKASVYSVKRFTRTKSDGFVTTDFLELDREIALGHFDWFQYDGIINQIPKGTHVIMSDLDGTLLEGGVKFNDDVLMKLKSYSTLLVVTGRTRLDKETRDFIRISTAGFITGPYFIDNRWNLGMSSRVLKKYVLKMLLARGCTVTVLEDRFDVMEHLFPSDPAFSKISDKILTRTATPA